MPRALLVIAVLIPACAARRPLPVHPACQVPVAEWNRYVTLANRHIQTVSIPERRAEEHAAVMAAWEAVLKSGCW